MVRWQGIMIHCYLDDWLIQAQDNLQGTHASGLFTDRFSWFHYQPGAVYMSSGCLHELRLSSVHCLILKNWHV